MKELQQKLESALRALTYGKTIRAHRDWFLLLLAALIVLLGSGAFNAWLFTKVVRGEFLGEVPEEISAPALDTLETVKEVLEERRAKALFYRSEASFVDPARLTE